MVADRGGSDWMASARSPLTLRSDLISHRWSSPLKSLLFGCRWEIPLFRTSSAPGSSCEHPVPAIHSGMASPGTARLGADAASAQQRFSGWSGDFLRAVGAHLGWP